MAFRPARHPQQRRPLVAAIDYVAPPPPDDPPPRRLCAPSATNPAFRPWSLSWPQQARKLVAAQLAPVVATVDEADPTYTTATTSAQFVTLLEAPDLEVDFGADLLDADETWLADVSADLEAPFHVNRNVFKPIHGSCRFQIARQLQWSRHRLRPWMTITSHTELLTATWTMGVWVLSTPDREIGETPETYSGQGLDKLVLVDTPCGRTYSVASGSAVIAAVESILSTEVDNVGTVSIDQTSAASTLPADRVWPAATSWLTIVNELLASVGYEGLSMGRDGSLTSRPYRQPSERQPSWSFSAESSTSIVGEIRTLSQDTTDTPNVWVGIRRNVDAPVDGAGRVEVVNQSDGPTSIVGRGGRRVRRVDEYDAVDDTVLLAEVQRTAADDRAVAVKLALETGLVPLLWHLDVVELVDNAITGSQRWAVEEWSLDLSGGSEMTHRWRQVVTV